MVLLPEIFSHVGRYLSPMSCLACVLVCREWRDIFTPCLWSEIDTAAEPWQSILRSVPLKALPDLLFKHRAWIRHLEAHKDVFVRVALKANINSLRSLTVSAPRHTFTSPSRLDDDPIDYLAVIASDKLWSEHIAEMLLETNLEIREHLNRTYKTLAVWRLVLKNPGLHCLTFNNTSSRGHMDWRDVPLIPAKESLLISVLSRVVGYIRADTIPTQQHLRSLTFKQSITASQLCSIVVAFPMLLCLSMRRITTDFGPEALLPSHLYLRTLTFDYTITASQLRAILIAFPVLRSLSVARTAHDNGCACGGGNNWGVGCTRWSMLEHPCLETLSVHSVSLILAANVRFPQVRHLKCAAFSLSTVYLIQKALQPFPALDRLKVLGAWQMVDPEISEEDGPGCEFMPYPLTTIICSECTQFAANTLALWFHFVVSLDLGTITTKVLVAITTTCGALEYARFELKEKCCEELCLFLAACSRLKECLGCGHVVLPEDLIDGPEWNCMALEKLDIDILASDLLNSSNQAELNLMCREDRFMPKTFTEKIALEHQENSYSIQKLVHAKLARHKSLLEIKFGPGGNPDARCATTTLKEPTLTRQHDLILRGFNFSWASGFGQVASLPKLQLIEISGTFAVYTMWEYRQQWMLNGWKIECSSVSADPFCRITARRCD
ncbi:hypothetical protein BGZ47_011100 [Haplosporangium gracile]|nr:hypothetical protein BGZ47_011100 [Haplosporangium gracile]